MRSTRSSWRAALLGTLAVLLLLLPAACGADRTPTVPPSTTSTTLAPGGKLLVIATTTQISAMAQAVAGDLAEVRSILAPGADAHEFEPRPSDVQAISTGNLVLRNGLGLDEWLDNLIANAGGSRPVYVVTTGIPLREQGEDAHENGDAAEGTAGDAGAARQGEEDAHADGGDPHVWFSVTNAITMTRNIASALAEADPANAPTFQANAGSYVQTLQELDSYIMGQVATIPESGRKMVTNHDAFGYYIERYGLTFVGSIIPSMSSEAQPSAQDVADLIARIKAQNVKAIFLESSINPSLARQVAADAGVKVVDTLYADSLGPPGSPGATYEGMMRFNTDAIVAALK